MPILNSDLETYLQALSDELLHKDQKYTLLIIGGAVIMGHYGFRASTHDVDCKLLGDSKDDDFYKAAEKVARRFDLEPDWINSAADQFGHITEEVLKDLETWFAFEALQVFRPSTEALLAMKIEAARIRPDTFDVDDAANLLCQLGIKSLEGATGIWRKYYPDSRLDELVFRDKKQFLRQAFAKIPE